MSCTPPPIQPLSYPLPLHSHTPWLYTHTRPCPLQCSTDRNQSAWQGVDTREPGRPYLHGSYLKVYEMESDMLNTLWYINGGTPYSMIRCYACAMYVLLTTFTANMIRF